MKFSDRLRTFMKGRYGPDELYNFLFIIYIFLFIINIFIKSTIINFVECLIIIIMLYRFFSKKIYIRSRENKKFLEIKKSILKPFNNLKRNIKDKEHVYKRCRKCKTVLKLPLPNKGGFNMAKCPHCKNRVRLFTFKKDKIEIIKKK